MKAYFDGIIMIDTYSLFVITIEYEFYDKIFNSFQFECHNYRRASQLQFFLGLRSKSHNLDSTFCTAVIE